MAQQILVNVDDPDEIIAGYGAGAKVRIERDTTAAFVSPTEIATLTLVSGQTQYEYWDGGGADASWYRSRYSATAGAPFSTYSDPFQPGAPTAYASLNSLREYLDLPDDSKDNMLVDLLRQATDYMIGKMGRDCFRHPPISGTETRLLSVDWRSSDLDVGAGIISLDLIRVAAGTGGAWTSLTAATDWRLSGGGQPYIGVGGAMFTVPSRYIELTDVAPLSRWYTGYDVVELTGAFGFPAVPSLVEKATLDLAREWYRQGPGGGGPVGVNQYGTPLFAAGLPRTVADAIREFGVGPWVVS